MIKNVRELEKLLKIKLTEKQRKVFNRKETYLLWGGSSAAGKSFLLSFLSLYYALRFEGSVSLIGRKFQSSLVKTTQISFENLLKKLPKDYLIRHDKGEGYFEFKNHSRVYFVGLAESRESLKKLTGIELIFAGVDECQDFDDDSVFLFLVKRLRQKIEGVEPKLLLTCNPNRQKWILDLWMGRKKKDFCFLRALPKDNKENLPKDYLGAQKRVLPRLQYEILIKGSWKDAQIEDCLFDREKIEEAVRREDFQPGKISYGVDIGLKGTTVVAKKWGNRISLPIILRDSNFDEFMEKIEEEIKDRNIPIYIDAIGEGSGVAIILEREKFNTKKVIQNERALNSDKYFNLRAENFDRLNLILNELILPNDQELIDQMLGCKKDMDKEGRIKIESKKKLHDKNQSPDKLDAVVLSCVGEGKTEEEFFEDSRGIYELIEGKKVYLINYQSTIAQMVNQGRIGRLEVTYRPETISENDLQRLKYQGFIRQNWEERRKEFFSYIRKYELTGKKDWGENLKFKY